MKFLISIFVLIACSVSSNVFADRNALEIESLSGTSIKACGQNAALGISWKEENEDPQLVNDNYFMFLMIRSASTQLSAACIAAPLSPPCLNQFGYLQVPNKRLISFKADLFPNLYVAVAAVTNNPSDPVVYSKAKRVDFLPCPFTSIPAITAGTGQIPASVNTAEENGPVGHPRKSIIPVVKWASNFVTTIGGTGYPAKTTVSLLTYSKNVDKVYLEAKTQDGLLVGHIAIPGTDLKVDPETGLDTYSAEISSDQWPAGSTIEVRAVVKFLIGKTAVLAGPVTADSRKTDAYGLTIFNNRNNSLVTPITRRVSVTGADTPNCSATSSPPCCGGSNACRTIEGAFIAQRNIVNPGGQGLTDLSGLTVLLEPGNYEIGTTQAYWPGFTASKFVTIKGTKNSLGRILTTISGRKDLVSYGYPGAAWLFDGHIRYQSLNLKNAPGPNSTARRSILPVSTNPATSTEAVDVHFEGVGLDGVNPFDGTGCLGDTDGFAGTFARVLLSSFTRFMGNGNQWAYFLSLLSNASISLSEVFKAGNMLIEFDQTGKHPVAPYSFAPQCYPGIEPHGDGIRLSGVPHSAFININTTDEGINRGQGVFLSGLAQLPGREQIYMKDIDMRVGVPGEIGVGRALLVSGLQYGTFVNFSVVGGPTTGACGDSGQCAAPGVYFCGTDSDNSNNLFGADGNISGYLGGDFNSSSTGYRYRNQTIGNMFSIP